MNETQSSTDSLEVQKVTLLKITPVVEPDRVEYPCDTNATCSGLVCTDSGVSC